MRRPGGRESGGGSTAEARAAGPGSRAGPNCRSRLGADPWRRQAWDRRTLSVPRPSELGLGVSASSCCCCNETEQRRAFAARRRATWLRCPRTQRAGNWGARWRQGARCSRSPKSERERLPRRRGGYTGRGGGGGAGAVDSGAGAGRAKVGGEVGVRGGGGSARAGFGGEGGQASRDGQTPPLQADSSNDVTVP